MPKTLSDWLLLAVMSCLLIAQPAMAADDAGRRHLVTVQWLEKNLGSADVVLLDASPPPMYAARHIAGAVSVDAFSIGARDPSAADTERRMQSWGVSPGKKVVIYDQGASFMATMVFFDLYYHGFASADLFILDGGLSKWQAEGKPITKEPTPAPKPGTFRVTGARDDSRVRLPEFLNASGDPAKHALVEVLEPSYHFGETKFFDRAGHVPNAIMWQSHDLFNADKTFKSADEIRRMASYLGIRPEQQVHTYCGGGGAATASFFALKFMLDYPQVKLYRESQREWLRDERGLPFWTYSSPSMKRDMAWLAGWDNRMLRAFSVTQLSVVDVRPAEAYKQGHVPFSLNIPADVFTGALDSPQRLAEVLGPAGVNPSHEAVIVSDGGLNPRSALAFVMLERLGQKKVSVMMDSVDEWALRGFPLTKEPTIVGPRKSPQDLAVPATSYPVNVRAGVMMVKDSSRAQGPYPKVFIASGKNPPAADSQRQGKLVHVPYTELVNPDGSPKAAKDIWKILDKAGVPRYAEIICVSDDPGEAAVNYFVLKLMGYPDVKVLVG